MKPTTPHLAARVGRAERKAEPAGGRGQIDDAAAARRLEHRHGQPRAVEHAVQVDGDAALPVLDVDVLDLAGGPGDAGVVDQHVEAAELRGHRAEQHVDLAGSATSATTVPIAGMRARERASAA